MKKIRPTKLAVSRETIKTLSAADLRQAAGGIDSAPADTCAAPKLALVPPAATH